MWCIASLTKEYRRRMYKVLDIYDLEYNRAFPVICFDEKSKQLLEDARESIPGKIGSPEKIDYEYKRQGTRNIFVAVEPKRGKRFTKVTRRRGKKDFAYFMKDLIMRKYAKAKKITIILDNLNTHFIKSFFDTFCKEEAECILKRVEFVYTPKHASWLNMAEIEINVLETECLKRRLGNETLLKKEIIEWQKASNKKNRKINWKFTRRDAYNKMKHHYIS